MTIKQFCNGEHEAMFFATPAQRHAARALEQVAGFAAQVAIARWSGEVEGKSMLDARAEWMAQVHGGLQQWLEGGGFAQEDAVVVEMPRVEGKLTFPGSRPMFYSLFRRVGSTAD